MTESCKCDCVRLMRDGFTCCSSLQGTEMVERVQWQGWRTSSSQSVQSPGWQDSGQGCSHERGRWHGSSHCVQLAPGSAACAQQQPLAIQAAHDAAVEQYNHMANQNLGRAPKLCQLLAYVRYMPSSPRRCRHGAPHRSDG